MTDKAKATTICQIKSLADCLGTIAEKSSTMESFLRNVNKQFNKIGQGAFRVVFDAGNFVVKIRRHEPWEENEYCMEGQRGILASNREERAGYNRLKKNAPHLKYFVMEPHYFKLANGHNVIIMEKATMLGKALGCSKDEYGYYEINSDDLVEGSIVERQHAFINENFADSHDNNMGINKDGLLVMIDFNFNHTDYSNNLETIEEAKNIYREVTGKDMPLRKKMVVNAHIDFCK
jgi:hypothetical protein